MDTTRNEDLLVVNCGRCGKPLIVRLSDIKDKRSIDCSACEKQLPTWAETTQLKT